jgi:hypothetical protein
MTQEEKLAAMRSIFDACLAIAEKKGHDYAGDDNAMSNFDDFGWKGIIVRLGDKYHRLKNFVKQGEMKVKDESVLDTLMDAINYSALAIIQYKEDADA